MSDPIEQKLLQQGYKLVGEYKNNKTPCQCECIRCNYKYFLILHHIKRIKKCNNCKNAEIINFFKDNNCKLLSSPSLSKPMQYICSCGNESLIKWHNFKLGVRCKKCSIAKTIQNNPKRIKIKNFIHDYFEKEGCILLEKEYHNQKTLMKYICNCKEESFISWKNFKKGHRCEKCAKNKIKNRFIPKGEDHFRWNPNREEIELNKKIRSKIKYAYRRSLKLIKKSKYLNMFDNLLYSKEDLIKHIISHPNWDNVKNENWELDHYFPIKAFIEYKIYDEKIINSLDNLRPLKN
jgi:hypothetical protein